MELHCKQFWLLALVVLMAKATVHASQDNDKPRSFGGLRNISQLNLRRLRHSKVDATPESNTNGNENRGLKYEKSYKYEKVAKSSKYAELYETKQAKAEKFAKEEKYAKSHKGIKHEKGGKYEKKAKSENHGAYEPGTYLRSVNFEFTEFSMSMSMSMP